MECGTARPHPATGDGPMGISSTGRWGSVLHTAQKVTAELCPRCAVDSGLSWGKFLPLCSECVAEKSTVQAEEEKSTEVHLDIQRAVKVSVTVSVSVVSVSRNGINAIITVSF